MENIARVPVEMVKIIPTFDGDTRLLPLFIKKCEYILSTFQGGNLQNEYLFHVVTSRLTGEAANLVGEREQITSWEELKLLLNQHFGDPRSEDCLALELESLKIRRNESYLEFCHRIQHIRSILFSKINETVNDVNLRQAKQAIYNNSSLNVFLYNLPYYLVRLVRLRQVSTLEDALKTVLEEQNFQTVYDSRNSRPNQNFKPNYNSPSQSYNQIDNRRGTNTNNNFNDSRNNSQQFRNIRQNSFNYNNQQTTTRSPRSSPQQQRQQFADNTFGSFPTPTTSGNNTDVTMRTASSRRVNYIDNNNLQPCSSRECNENNENTVENFYIRASADSIK